MKIKVYSVCMCLVMFVASCHEDYSSLETTPSITIPTLENEETLQPRPPTPIPERTIASIGESTDQPIFNFLLSFWDNPEKVNEWAIYTYDIASGSSQKVTKNYGPQDFEIDIVFNGYPYSWSVDGKWLAIEYDIPREESQIHIYSISPKNNSMDKYITLNGKYPSFSPVEEKIVYVDDGIQIFDVNTETDKKLYFGKAWIPKISPYGDRLIFISKSESNSDLLYLYDFADANLQKIALLNTGFIVDFEWSPLENQLLVISEGIYGPSTELYLVTIDKSEFSQVNVSEVLLGKLDGVVDLSWSPSGGVVAITLENLETIERKPDRLLVLDIESYQILYELRNKEIYDIQWSPDGRYLVYLDKQSGRNYITIRDREKNFEVVKNIAITRDIFMIKWVPN